MRSSPRSAASSAGAAASLGRARAPLAARIAVLVGAVAALSGGAPPRPCFADEVRLPSVTVTDADGRARTLPDPSVASVIVYEDRDAQAENAALKDRLATLAARPANRARFRFVPVADVAKWDFWPARGYVLDSVREARRQGTEVLLDWRASMRSAWRLDGGRSHVRLLLPGGRLAFAADGRLGDGARRELLDRLAALGVDVK